MLDLMILVGVPLNSEYTVTLNMFHLNIAMAGHTDCTSMHTEHSHTALAASSHPLLQLSRMEEH